MSKKATYNGPFFNAFAQRLHGTEIRFGILIGTEVSEGQRDLVFSARTPPQLDEEGNEVVQAKDVAALLKSKAAGTSFTDWAVQHYAAIQRLLPGGLEPCGCFAVVGEASARDIAPLLAPLLKSTTDPVVLTIDPTSRKLSFWQYSGGAKPALRPAQIKADPHKDALLLWCSTPVDLLVPCDDAGDSSSSLADRSDVVADTAEKSIGSMLEKRRVGAAFGEAPLQVLDLTSDTAVSSVVPKDCSEARMSFLRGGTSLSVAHEKSDGEAGHQVRVRCLVVATALILRRNCELRHAVGLLRKAIASSAAERLRLGLDEAAEDQTSSNARARVQLPWRALCKPPETELPLWCCDYCMPDEDVSAALDRLSELLGLPQSEFEEAPLHLSERQRLADEHKGTYEATVAESTSGSRMAGQGKKNAVPIAACAAAVGALVLAAAIPILMKL